MLPPIRLAVGNVEVASEAQYPANMNFIGRRRSELLAQDAQTFLRSRLEAAGGVDVARPRWSRPPSSSARRDNPGGAPVHASRAGRWSGTLALKVAIVDGLGIEQGFASSRVQITRSISPRMGVEAKDNFSRTLSNDLIQASSRELEQSIDPQPGQPRLSSEAGGAPFAGSQKKTASPRRVGRQSLRGTMELLRLING